MFYNVSALRKATLRRALLYPGFYSTGVSHISYYVQYCTADTQHTRITVNRLHRDVVLFRLV